MDFAIRNLAVLAYAQGFTHWHYKCPTNINETIFQEGFFNDAKDMFKVGDMITVSWTGSSWYKERGPRIVNIAIDGVNGDGNVIIERVT